MWKEYFSITGCKQFVIPGLGEFDASKDNMPLEKVKKAYEKGCQFIAPTTKGIETYYPDMKKIEPAKMELSDKKKIK